MNFSGVTNFVGIDPSLTGTAICVLRSGYETPHYCATLPSAKKDFSSQLSRYVKVSELVINVLDEYIDKEDEIDYLICLEGYSFGSRGAAVFSLAEFGGILRKALADTFTEYFEVPPTVLKKFVTGKGNANKAVMLEKTYRKFGVGSELLADDNQVDAFGLAQFAKGIAEGTLPKEFLKKYTHTTFGTVLCKES